MLSYECCKYLEVEDKFLSSVHSLGLQWPHIESKTRGIIKIGEDLASVEIRGPILKQKLRNLYTFLVLSETNRRGFSHW